MRRIEKILRRTCAGIVELRTVVLLNGHIPANDEFIAHVADRCGKQCGRYVLDSFRGLVIRTRATHGCQRYGRRIVVDEKISAGVGSTRRAAGYGLAEVAIIHAVFGVAGYAQVTAYFVAQ